eukprot:gene24825-biopygen22428
MRISDSDPTQEGLLAETISSRRKTGTEVPVTLKYAWDTHGIRIRYASDTHRARVSKAEDLTCESDPPQKELLADTISARRKTGHDVPVTLKYAWDTHGIRITYASDTHRARILKGEDLACWDHSATSFLIFRRAWVVSAEHSFCVGSDTISSRRETGNEVPVTLEYAWNTHGIRIRYESDTHQVRVAPRTPGVEPPRRGSLEWSCRLEDPWSGAVASRTPGVEPSPRGPLEWSRRPEEPWSGTVAPRTPGVEPSP